MKALLVSAAAIGLLSATPAFAQAGPTATANGSADAIIVNPITVSQGPEANGGSLNFGKIAAIAGTVTVPADGTAASSTPNMIVDGTGIKRAHFVVGGESGLAYSIAFGSSTNSITLNGPSASTMGATLALSNTTGTLGTNNDFYVGGTLNVANGQTVGSYTGAFNVAVQYN